MKIEVDHQRGRLTPVHLRVGRHVYQRLNPIHQGTVVQADDAGFTVTYDSHGRGHREPRVRHWFPISRAWDFVPGKPAIDYVTVAPSDEP